MEMKRETILKALRTVAAHVPACTPREFARVMWPDSAGWERPSKRGSGGPSGACMNSAGACMLGALAARWLVERAGRGYVLTSSGRDYLEREGLPRLPAQTARPIAVALPHAYWGLPWPRPLWNGSVWVHWNGFAFGTARWP